MFLDKQIDFLKQQFPPEDFKVPFTTGNQILGSIEAGFIIQKGLRNTRGVLHHKYSNWGNSIKNMVQVGTVDLNMHHEWLDKLDPTVNYWMVIAYQNDTSFRHYVYDCKPNSLQALHNVTKDDFFIVDKKYRWLAFFSVDKQTKQASIFRSGEKLTPFDR